MLSSVARKQTNRKQPKINQTTRNSNSNKTKKKKKKKKKGVHRDEKPGGENEKKSLTETKKSRMEKPPLVMGKTTSRDSYRT